MPAPVNRLVTIRGGDKSIASQWCDHMSTVYFHLDCIPEDESMFSGELSVIELPRMGISKFTADAVRTVRHAKTAVDEDLAIIFPTFKNEDFGHLGVEGTVKPGEIVILNASENYWTTISDNSSNITVKINRALMQDRVPFIDRTYGRKEVANSGFVPLIAQLAAQALAAGPLLDDQQLRRLDENILDLMCLMLETPSCASPRESCRESLLSVTFNRGLDFITANFRDSELTPEDLATALRVSTRYVHKVFQAHGTTFGKEVLMARLAESDRLLKGGVSGRFKPSSMADIAYASGFSSQSYFSARFKDHYGVTPSEFRSAGR